MKGALEQKYIYELNITSLSLSCLFVAIETGGRGVVKTLSNLVSHMKATIQLNAFWGLMEKRVGDGIC